ncbi:hypothetical protein BDR03DRAFT_985590 [Suillus americanus]|nr:hypothetical protein BDR03DRAFT_985590 [Suillus americanus]
MTDIASSEAEHLDFGSLEASGRLNGHGFINNQQLQQTSTQGQPQPHRLELSSNTLPVLPPRSALRPGRNSMVMEEARRRSREREALDLQQSQLKPTIGLTLGSSHPITAPPATRQQLPKMLPMLQLAPEPETVPVFRTHSFSSLSQLLEALGSTPDLHSVIGVVDEFEDEFDRERETEHLVSDTLPTALHTSYTGPVAAYTDYVGADTANAGHTPTMESAHTIIQSTRFPKDKELPLPPSTLPLSIPMKSRPRTDNRLDLSEDRSAVSSQRRSEDDLTTAPPTPAPAITKRQHALLELLTSERAYASDLALIRDVYMRLASGHPPPFGFSCTRPVSGSEISNPGSSSSSESTKSSSGTCSSLSSRTVSTISTSDISVSGLCPPTIQLNVPSVQLNVPTFTQIVGPLTDSKAPKQLLRPVGEPPLSVTDTRIIFRNISELAVLSDMLVSKLETAIEGGKGVGEVFLEVVPLFAPPYTTYITAHPRALAHLDVLSTSPQLTPQFSRWLKESKELVEAHTHAWDLPSLLIKPVQRLLKYGLLLGAVISATPEPLVVVTSESIGEAFGKLREGTEGLDKLREAKQKVEEVARAVNEGRRRVEVVREVLGSGHAKDGPGASGIGSIGMSKVGVVNASVSRMRSLRTPKSLASSAKLPSKQKGSIHVSEIEPDPENAEAALIGTLESRLKSHITTLSHLARDAFGYARTLHTLFGALVKWGWAFAGVIGVSVSPELSPNNSSSNPSPPSSPDTSGTGQSEAFDAFLSLCTGLVELVQDLEHELHAHILPSLQSLKGTSVAPLKLLSALHTLQPLHMHLLHLPITRKQRPSEALLQASQSYVALRGQLALELPVYVKLLERGIDGVVLELARGMEAFWGVVRERWGELWDALRVEGEGLGDEGAGATRDSTEHADRPAGGGETVRVWRERWGDVLGVLGSLAVVNPPKKMERLRPVIPQYQIPQHVQHRTSPPQGAKSANLAAVLGPLDTQVSPTRPRQQQHQHQGSYDARYAAKESYEGRSRRDETKYTREKEYDARHSSGSGSYDIPYRLNDPRSSQNSYDPRNSQSSYESRNPQNSYDHWSSQSSSSSFNAASRTSHSHSNSYDITGRRRSGSTNNIPTGPILRKPSDESLRSGKSGKSGKSYKNNPGTSTGRGIEDVPPMPSAQQAPSQSRSGASPPRLKPTRMKSLPGPILSNIPFVLDPPPSPSSFATFDEEQEDNDRDRGRVSQRRPSLKSKITDTLRPSHHRTRSSSVKSLGAPSSLAPSYYSTDSALPAYPTTPTRTHSPHTPTRRTTDLQGLRALYQCAAIHMCIPPAGVSYRGLPFFELRSGDTFDVLREYGHPSTHPDLPLYVDDGEDCLLLVRELADAEGGGRDVKVRGEVGWALASFLVPLD